MLNPLKSFEKASSITKWSYTLLIVIAGMMSAFALYLFDYTKQSLDESLQKRLYAIVTNASQVFTDDEMAYLITLTPEERSKSDLYRDVVQRLRRIKAENPDVTFAYIYGRTDDSNMVQFIADADVLALKPELNFNEYEQTDDGYTGSTYDVTDIPIISDGTVFQTTIIDPDFYETIWGDLMTSYAPIRNSTGGSGDVSAVLGIDVNISDYNRIVYRTFLPFGIFIVVLLTSLVVMTILMVRMWGSRVQILQELDRQKDELLSIVSHQLATPVSSLKWYMEMLLDGDLGKISKEQKEHIRTMVSVGANLSDLIGMILDVSRIQLGRMKVDKQELDLGLFFTEILEIVSPKASTKQIKFDVKIPKKFPKAMLDKRYTFMVIENLLTNAIKYTPEKGRVGLSVEIIGNSMRCVVSDNGCGIPKKDQEQIFGKLFRASNVRNSVEGNGFGLFVAKGAVEAQGGKITFVSKENEGTTFTVDLPLQG